VLYKDVWFKDVLDKDVLFKDMWFRDVSYKDVLFKDVFVESYKDVHCRVITWCSCINGQFDLKMWFKDER